MNATESRRQQLRDLFTQLITAYGEKDFTGFAEFVHPDAEFDWPYLPLKEFAKSLRGRDAFIRVSEAGMAGCDGYHHVVDRFYDQADPDSLIVEYHSHTILPATGKVYSNEYLGILRFRDSQVIYWREYVNPLKIIEAYGLEFVNTAVSS